MDLSQYDNSWYSSRRSRLVQAIWFFLGQPVLRSFWIPWSGVRRALLRAFGAKIGRGVVIKPGVRVKYPWLLEIGDHSWIGEDAWVDNLAFVQIGSNVCVSQGAYLCTGSHDWRDPHFGLLVKPILVRDGAWIGAKAIVCLGVEIEEGAVATAGSVVTKCLKPNWIYAGNPAAATRARFSRVPNETELATEFRQPRRPAQR